MDKRAIVLHHKDNVATAIADLDANDVVQIEGRPACIASEQVPFGHKIALLDIPAGAPVVKYGEQIGLAANDIAQGGCVHTNNVESQRGRGDRLEEEKS